MERECEDLKKSLRSSETQNVDTERNLEVMESALSNGDAARRRLEVVVEDKEREICLLESEVVATLTNGLRAGEFESRLRVAEEERTELERRVGSCEAERERLRVEVVSLTASQASSDRALWVSMESLKRERSEWESSERTLRVRSEELGSELLSKEESMSSLCGRLKILERELCDMRSSHLMEVSRLRSEGYVDSRCCVNDSLRSHAEGKLLTAIASACSFCSSAAGAASSGSAASSVFAAADEGVSARLDVVPESVGEEGDISSMKEEASADQCESSSVGGRRVVVDRSSVGSSAQRGAPLSLSVSSPRPTDFGVERVHDMAASVSSLRDR